MTPFQEDYESLKKEICPDCGNKIRNYFDNGHAVCDYCDVEFDPDFIPGNYVRQADAMKRLRKEGMIWMIDIKRVGYII